MKKSNGLKSIFYCCICVFLNNACEKLEPIPDPEPYVPGYHGVFILNEGGWRQNEASLSFYNLETGKLTPDILNGELGDTAQDMIVYGNKLYITVSESSRITVVSIDSNKSIQAISLFDETGAPRMPRYLAAYAGKVYATTYDGHVVRIDTATFATAIAPIGACPDGIAAVNGKLYIANSGGYNAIPDSTLSVVDIARFEEEKKIKVGVNPYFVKADSYGNLYVTYRGDYNNPSVPGGIQKVDIQTESVVNLPFQAQKFDIVDDWLYFYNVTYDNARATSGSFGIYDIQKEVLTSHPIISDGTVLSSPYAIGVNPKTKDVYISNWNYSGKAKIYVFDSAGQRKISLEAGIGTNTFYFIDLFSYDL